MAGDFKQVGIRVSARDDATQKLKTVSGSIEHLEESIVDFGATLDGHKGSLRDFANLAKSSFSEMEKRVKTSTDAIIAHREAAAERVARADRKIAESTKSMADARAARVNNQAQRESAEAFLDKSQAAIKAAKDLAKEQNAADAAIARSAAKTAGDREAAIAKMIADEEQLTAALAEEIAKREALLAGGGALKPTKARDNLAKRIADAKDTEHQIETARAAARRQIVEKFQARDRAAQFIKDGAPGFTGMEQVMRMTGAKKEHKLLTGEIKRLGEDDKKFSAALEKATAQREALVAKQAQDAATERAAWARQVAEAEENARQIEASRDAVRARIADKTAARDAESPHLDRARAEAEERIRQRNEILAGAQQVADDRKKAAETEIKGLKAADKQLVAAIKRGEAEIRDATQDRAKAVNQEIAAGVALGRANELAGRVGTIRDARATARAIPAEAGRAISGKTYGDMAAGADRATAAQNRLNRSVQDGASGFNSAKHYVQSLISAYAIYATTVSQARAVIDAARLKEQTIFTLSASVQGDMAKAAADFDYLAASADKYGFAITGVADSYGKLANTARGMGRKEKDLRSLWEGVLSAGRVYNLSDDKMGDAMRALTQMLSKGQVMSEELKGQLAEALPNAYIDFAAAQGYGLDRLQDFAKDLEGGKFGAEAVIKYGEYVRTKFAGDIARASDTLNAQLAKLKNTIFDARNDLADAGFLDGVKDTVKELNEFFESDAGQKYLAQMADVAQGLASSIALVARHLDKVVLALAVLGGAKAAQAMGRVGSRVLDGGRDALRDTATGIAIAGTGNAAAGAAGGMTRMSAAATTAGRSLVWLRGAASSLMGVLGGLPGIALIAGAALWSWSSRTNAEEVVQAQNRLETVKGVVQGIGTAAIEAGNDVSALVAALNNIDVVKDPVKNLAARRDISGARQDIREQLRKITYDAVVKKAGLNKGARGMAWGLSEFVFNANAKNTDLAALNRGKDPGIDRLLDVRAKIEKGGFKLDDVKKDIADLIKAFPQLADSANDMLTLAESMDEVESAQRQLIDSTDAANGNIKAQQRVLDEAGERARNQANATIEAAKAQKAFEEAMKKADRAASDNQGLAEYQSAMDDVSKTEKELREGLKKWVDEAQKSGKALPAEEIARRSESISRAIRNMSRQAAADLKEVEAAARGVSIEIGNATAKALESYAYGSEMPVLPNGVSRPGSVLVPNGQGGIASSTLVDLLKKHESGGSYDTLLGHQQRAGGKFAGTQITKMTIGQLLEFAGSGGAYAGYSRQAVGRMATPMGVGQIVGKTLGRTAEQLGLPRDTVFNEDTQNLMVNHLAWQRVRGKTKQQARAALRAEWEGFKHATDAQLDQVYDELNVAFGGKAGPREYAQRMVQGGSRVQTAGPMAEERVAAAGVTQAIQKGFSKAAEDIATAYTVHNPAAVNDVRWNRAMESGDATQVAAYMRSTGNDADADAFLRASQGTEMVRAAEGLIAASKVLEEAVSNAKFSKEDFGPNGITAEALNREVSKAVAEATKDGVSLAQAAGTATDLDAKNALVAGLHEKARAEYQKLSLEASREQQKVDAESLLTAEQRVHLATIENEAERQRQQFVYQRQNEERESGVTRTDAQRNALVESDMRAFMAEEGKRLAKEQQEASEKALTDALKTLQDRAEYLKEQMAVAVEDGDFAAQGRLRGEITATNAEILKMLDSLEAFYAAMGGPQGEQGVIQVRRFRLETQQATQDLGRMSPEAEKLAGVVQGNLNGAFSNFAQAVAEGQDPWKALTQSVGQAVGQILIDIGRMIVEAMIARAVMAAIGMDPSGNPLPNQAGGAGGGGGNFLGQAFNFLGSIISGGIFHDGGIIGDPSKRIDFMNALMNLKPGERPIIAMDGEEMLTEDDPRHRNNLGSALGRIQRFHTGGVIGMRSDTLLSKANPAAGLLDRVQDKVHQMAAPRAAEAPIAIHNHFDPQDLLSAALSGPAGERTIINALVKNRHKLKGMLG
ncbi:tape measure protein [Paracoccus sanguinis]|uniref:Tape measure protein N-terminal domain-containing protein n=1 Tax=Paracoccus sanguinis TaxID=1545044 RepID=A0A099GLP1_9RHOB|nr:tape measure protein [Paracoccus sanguinis]KGJ23759.1 hypothetical protein IX56_00335 [Paracoccus sanguinis]